MFQIAKHEKAVALIIFCQLVFTERNKSGHAVSDAVIASLEHYQRDAEAANLGFRRAVGGANICSEIRTEVGRARLGEERR